MSSRDFSAYPLAHFSNRRGSITSIPPTEPRTSSDTDIPCHPFPSDCSTRKRRKSVTFSSVALVSDKETTSYASSAASRNRRESIASSPGESLHVTAPSPPISVLSLSTNQEHTRNRRDSIKAISTANPAPAPLKDSPDNPPSPRKRRFSIMSSPPEYSSPLDDGEAHHSPRKRKTSTQPSQQHTVDPKPSSGPPLVQKPPPEVCAQVNSRVRSTLDRSSLDFVEHVRHRTYVVRSLSLAPGHECVMMLDAGVDSLMPAVFPSPPSFNEKNFIISKAPGKGLGMFAQRLIRPNEIIFVEHPVVITPYVVGASVPLSHVYADMFGRLSDRALAEFKGLPFPGSEQSQKKTPYEAIIRANSIAISLPVPKEAFAELATHKAVFRRMSRCNHSCGPNSRWKWDRKTFSLVLTAVRQINPRDEITIAYISPHFPFDARREALLDLYSFECLCPHCIKPKADIHQSDADRRAVYTFWNVDKAAGDPFSKLPAFDKWCLGPSIPAHILIDAHRNALDIIHNEGLEILDTHPGSGPGQRPHPHRDVGRHIDAIAMCYGALEDADRFLIWVRKAADAREKDHPELKLVFSKWMSNPMSFPVWGWRKAFCTGDVQDVKRLSKGLDGDETDNSTVGLAACIGMGMFGFVGK